jgi:hypothetical protein
VLGIHNRQQKGSEEGKIQHKKIQLAMPAPAKLLTIKCSNKFHNWPSFG